MSVGENQKPENAAVMTFPATTLDGANRFPVMVFAVNTNDVNHHQDSINPLFGDTNIG